MIDLWLPYPLSTNRYHRVFRGRAVRSREANDYRLSVAAAAHQAGLFSPLAGHLSVRYTLHPVQPKDWMRRAKREGEKWHAAVRCIDLGNCEKVASDCLQGIVIENDSQFVRIDLVRGMPVEGGALRVEIGLA